MSPPILCRGPSDRPAFALTYDDGPEPGGTDRLLEVLEARDVRATFFCVGDQVHDHPDLGHALVAAGHEVGSHTMQHHGHAERPELALADMIDGATAIEQELSLPPTLYRAPYGQFVGATLAEAERRGWTCVGWSTHGLDWDPLTAEAIAARIFDDLDSGAIVLLHDAQRYSSRRDDCTPTIQATELILDEAERRGLEPVTVSDLLS